MKYDVELHDLLKPLLYLLIIPIPSEAERVLIEIFAR
jgi:hypothetical protein